MAGGARDIPSIRLTLAVVVCFTAVAGLDDAQFTAEQFVAAIANVTDLQTSAGLVNTTLPIVGTPGDTVFLPTDAAWAAFRAANGAGAPDANRTVGILLYNSILSLGQASEAQLVQSSPLQSSAGELLSDLANSTVVLPLAFANVSSVIQATDVGGNTVNLTAVMNFSNTQVYATSGVLLPAASYGAVPETYVADVTALKVLAGRAPAVVAAPSPAPTQTATPTAAPSAGGAASSTASSASPAPSPAASSTAAPAPAPSAAAAARSALVCLLTLAAALLAAF